MSDSVSTSEKGNESPSIDQTESIDVVLNRTECQNINRTLSKQSKDMQAKMSNQIDKLDSLLSKTENAQYSMEHQNKHIKSLLKK